MTDATMPLPATAASTPFRGSGEMAARMRAFDWSKTPLGPVERWPVSLRTTVSTLLASRHAMFLWWGPELIQFYNDAYSESLGPDRHPSALGGRGLETWAEIWPIIGHEVESVLAGGPATWHEDHLVPITRGDRVHDVYWSYSYSPVLDDDGGVGGVLVTVQETTQRAVGARRVRLLQELGGRMHHAMGAADVCSAAATVLGAAPHDIAWALLYLREAPGAALRLTGSVGLEPGSLPAPHELPAVPPHPWPGGGIICDRWPEPVHAPIVIALAARSGEEAHGIVVLGLNPRLPLDAAHHEFTAQIAREIAAALDRVHTAAAERAATLVAARNERLLLEGVFQLSPSFLAVLRGPDFVYELANPAYHELIGHRAVVGMRLADALPEVAAQGFVEILEKVYRTGEPFVGNEVPVELPATADGALRARYVNFVFQPMRDSGGAVTAILVSGVDVSAMVQARAAAEQIAADRDAQRHQLLTVLEQSPVAIVIVDAASGRVLFANSKVAEVFGVGLPSDTLATEYRRQLRGNRLDGRELTDREWPMSRALAGEEIWNEVLEVDAGAEGRRVQIGVTAAPVRDADGRIIAAVSMFRDVTEERRVEAQLRNAQRLQAVGTLAGGVAHEINNQMTAVIGFGDFVLAALGPDHPQSPDVRLVLQAGQRAARISQQLLAFTRQQITHTRVLSLPDVVRDFRPVLQQLLGADKSLRIASGDAPLQVAADLEQVQQILINLVANARDATQTGAEVVITLEEATVGTELAAPLGEPVAPGRYALVSVSDAGIGMGRETLSRIFDPFFTTKPVGQGTGLGLPMVYGTMRRHGGYVVARSCEGVGTTMDLYWPIADSSAPAADDGYAKRRATDVAARAASLVLVVEDDPTVRALAVRTLEHEGYRVVSAVDGAEALALLEREGASVRIMVTDVIMPRMNGGELGEAVRARWPAIRVVYISGHTGEGQVLDRLVPPGAPYLQKPFTPDQLARAVAALEAPR